MKTKVLSLLIMFVFGTFMVFAESKTEKVEVKGNCGMCEKRIEKAALSVDGVSKAHWDKKTKELKVTYDDAKTDINAIQLAIAEVGHDTEKHKAKDEVYENLHSCCKYERDDQSQKNE